MISLDDRTHERIQALCARGDELAEVERYDDALVEYEKAWNLLPEPRARWDAALWITTAIGDAQFLSGRYSDAKQSFVAAISCGGPSNPFVHLRLGQCYFEEGDTQRASEELSRAYATGGREVFADEDPKYFALVKRVLKPPTGANELK